MKHIIVAIVALVALILSIVGFKGKIIDPKPPTDTTPAIVSTEAPTTGEATTAPSVDTTAETTEPTEAPDGCADCAGDCKCAPEVKAAAEVCICGTPPAAFSNDPYSVDPVNGHVEACKFAAGAACSLQTAADAAKALADATPTDATLAAKADAAAKAAAACKHDAAAACGYVAEAGCSRNCQKLGHTAACQPYWKAAVAGKAAVVCDNCFDAEIPGTCCK